MNRESLLENLNRHSAGTLMETLGIEYTDAGEGFLEATMVVTPAVHQPMGILHGGATAALAESVGSAASALRCDRDRETPVGLELAINHLRSLRQGRVTARAEALHLGRRTHLWSIRITDDDGRLIAQAKLTMMVVARDRN